jgi:hypothetical protein
VELSRPSSGGREIFLDPAYAGSRISVKVRREI